MIRDSLNLPCLVVRRSSSPSSAQYNKIQNMKHSNTILKRVVKQIATESLSYLVGAKEAFC
jgi:hypothetical protein